MADAGMQREGKLQLAKRRRVRWAIAAGVSLITCVVTCFRSVAIDVRGQTSVSLALASIYASHNEHLPPGRTRVSFDRWKAWPEWRLRWHYGMVQRHINPVPGVANPGPYVFMQRYVQIPLWPLPLLCSGIAAWHHRRVRRLSRMGCPTCGYDTRGLAAGAPCPECGTACSV